MQEARLRNLLKAWSARVNRAMLGAGWCGKVDEHLWFYGFLEKLKVNPHWHLIAKANKSAANDNNGWQTEFATSAQKAWEQLLPSGTIDIKRIVDRGAIDYSLKMVLGNVEYTNFVVPYEFSKVS